MRTTRVSLRWGVSWFFATAVAITLLWAMQYLIQSADASVSTQEPIRFVDFVRAPEPPPPPKPADPPEPPPYPAPPPDTPVIGFDDPQPTSVSIAITTPKATPRIETDIGFAHLLNDGDMLPFVKVAPVYPTQAIRRGVEGYCVVEFTVTAAGAVRDASVIAEQCSSPLFHRPAEQAALRFKYKPRIVDGAPIEVTGVRNKFRFELEDG